MSHYTTSYVGLTGDAKRDAAIADVREYMGSGRFEACNEDFIECYADQPPSLDEFTLIVSFAGVRGYPARAWYEHLWPDAEVELC